MSLKRLSLWAPQPATTRACPSQLSVDPTGERIAYGCGKSVFLRSVDDPSICTQYTGHTDTVNVARFSPSGYYVASGDASGKLRVWDCVSEEMATKGEFQIMSGPIKDIAWDGESKRIIAVGSGKERFGHCVMFDTGNSVGEITGQSSVINSVSIRQELPLRAVTASDDHTLVFYHGAPFKFAALLKNHHSNFVHGVAFSPKGEYFVSVGADRRIFLFDGKEGKFLAEINDAQGTAHKGSIMSVSWAPDSKRFATASADQTVKVWDAEARTLVRTWRIGPVSNGGPASVPYHQVGVVWTPRADGIIISLSLSGALNYLSEDSEEPTKIVTGHQKPVNALHLTRQKSILTGTANGLVYRWDIQTGVASIVQGEGHTNYIVDFAQMSPSSDSIISVAWDDKIRTINIPEGAFADNFISTKAQPIGVCVMSPEKFVLLTDSELRIYSASPFNLLMSEKLSFVPTSIAASPLGTDIAVAGQDSVVRIFTLTPSGFVSNYTLNANRSFGTAMAYSKDGKYIAVGDSSGLIMLYTTAIDGYDEQAYSIKTNRWAFHHARIGDIAWNAASTHIVSGSLDTNVYVYSVEKPMRNSKAENAHIGGINAVGWEEEDIVVSTGNDGTIKRWKVEFA